MTLKRSESNAATVHEIFSAEHTYRSPLFQRHFVWGDNQLDLLWSDIDSVLGSEAESVSRFLGALVLKPLSDTPPPFRPMEHWIIDGQQRLTTFYTLLIACAEQAIKLGGKALADDLVSDYLIHSKSSAKGEVKLLPTIPDLCQYKEIVHCIGEYQPKVPGGVYGRNHGPLADVYLRHCDEIEKRIILDGKPALSLLEELVKTLVVSIEFVVINLAQHHDANEVFNRLNQAGQPLEVIDLIRNEVFSIFAVNANEAEAIYENRWTKFEQALEVPGKENEKRSANLKNGFFFPYALIHNSGTTRAEVFNRLSTKWQDEIQGIDSAEQKATHIISSLNEFVGPYKALVIGDKYHNFTKELWEAIMCLVRMPAPSTFYPYGMQLLKAVTNGETTENEATQCFRVIESFLVRRAFQGMEPSGLHAVFKNLWKRAGADLEKVIQNIQTKTIEFPDDDEFGNKISNGNLYDRKLCSYVLMEYERSLLKGDMHSSTPPLTADHVMPQSRSGEWQSTISEDDYNELLHTWANLVPLSNKANAEKGTKNWAESKEIYDSETLFKSTRRVAKNFKTWDSDSIRKRAQSLQDWALNRWPKQI